MGGFQKPIPPPEQACSGTIECAATNPDGMVLVTLLGATGLVLILATFAIAHLEDARSLIREERGRVAAEARAFASFTQQVGDIDVDDEPVTDGGPTVTRTIEAGAADGLESVQQAYRGTVMAVPHYEAEYGESLPRNMHLEFGEDVAGAVERGGRLTPRLKATLLQRSRTARDQRVLLLDQLETEAEALEDAGGVLRRCVRTADRIVNADVDDRSFDDLEGEWRLLEERRDAVCLLLSDRQEAVQERDRKHATGERGPSFEEYVYDPLTVTYPVLAAGADVVDRLGRARDRVAASLASRT